MAYEAVIGLEVHIELSTKSKMFCGCKNAFGSPPNTHVCPVCLGLPGALPVANQAAVAAAVKMALALGCTVADRFKFDRKNYFYPDLPKGYQISQYDEPIGKGGLLHVGGTPVRITRIHLEEDAGKLSHLADGAAVDYNRSGVPLLEIVSEPDLKSAEQASAYMEELRLIAQTLGISDVRMEQGSLRADVNVSLRPEGSDALNPRAEIKNVNSFRSAERAIAYEIERQRSLYEAGEKVVPQTRGFDDATGRTLLQRSKESAQDYRYFPEPDLPPVTLDAAWVDELRHSLPPLPGELRTALEGQGLSAETAGLLVQNAGRLALYRQAVEGGGAPQAMANWVLGDVARLEAQTGVASEESALEPEALVALDGLWQAGKITGPAAKRVLEVLYSEGGRPAEVVERLGLGKSEDEGQVNAWIAEVLDQNPQAVADVKAGKEKAIAFLVGQLMRKSRGKVDPSEAQEALRSAISQR